MERVYETGTASSAKYFIGTEVERTPVHGAKTLFVVGLAPYDEIINLAKHHGCTAIYCGANQSFNPTNDLWDWDTMVCQAMYAGFWVTLDFDLKFANDVFLMACSAYSKFIPMISVKIPRALSANYNTTVKIDDIGFDQTNPGVWCWSLHELTDRAKFNDWTVYRNDHIIEDTQNEEE